jgi:hypothetical protein
MADLRDELIREADRLEEDVLYSEKAHFGMSTVWSRVHLFLGIPSVIAAAGSGVAAMKTNPLLALGLGTTSAVLTALLTFLEPKGVAGTHHTAGVAYGSLRGELRRLRLIDLPASSDPSACRSKLEVLAHDKEKTMKSAPHIGGLAYWLAKRSIEREEHQHKIDKAALR